MSKFTFTTAAVGFATSGLVFHLGLLDKMVRKLSLRPVLWIAMAIQQAGLTLCQFPAVHPLNYIAALLTSCGCCMLYSALFYLYGNFMYFGVVSSIAFAASTTFFYFSALSQYYLIGLQLLSVTSLALFFPKYPSSYWQQEKRKLLHKSQVLTLAVFGSIFSKNLMTVSYFSFDRASWILTRSCLFGIIWTIPVQPSRRYGHLCQHGGGILHPERVQQRHPDTVRFLPRQYRSGGIHLGGYGPQLVGERDA
uniref:Transmembrane domain-containing protein n=1 Tax=Spironucleus salmonicida TaxID=348837 RepID=V6LUQ2_9EUKA|eukprot:EST48357.1 Transmembrane domain-containing protein [Spironucleus salmonicida]